MAKVLRASHRTVEELSTGWEFAELPPSVESADSGVLERHAPAWLSAVVPGTVAAALRRHGRWSFDAPRDFDDGEWWYRLRFASRPATSRESLQLCFGGLATLADVWLNGQHLLRSDNMFLEHAVDVTHVVSEDNELLIRFWSLNQALKQRRPRPRWRSRLVDRQQLRWVRTTLLGRIPAWSPPVAPVGPWRAIRLERGSGPWLSAANIQPRLEAGRALVHARLRCQGEPAQSVRLVVGESSLALIQDAEGSWRGELTVDGAEPWWPHTHGGQPRYRAFVTITSAFGESSFDLGSVAFRSIEARTNDGDFALHVNGVELFCRGACWTTDDIVTLGGESPPTEALEQARAAGMNMLRIGGTMAYENDAFYEACDQLGILVWQDFMFANLDYPGENPAFLASVRAEAEGFLSRTETRACLTVLCGNSEVEQQVAMLGLPRESWKQPLFEEDLRRLSAEMRGDVPYVSSTPTGGALPFQVNEGISHYYGVGAYQRPLTDARHANVRFTSECLGFSNIPEPVTLEALLADGQAPFHHPRWKARVPRDAGPGWDFDDVRDHYTRLLFNVDTAALRYADAERALALGRVTTGEVMRQTLAEWRRPGSTCHGALIWFLKDLWPGAGWGLIDATGLPKAAYYYVKRTLQPVGLFISDEGLNGLVLNARNDTPLSRLVTLRLTLLRDGLTQVVEGERQQLALPARGSLELSSALLFEHFVDTTYSYRFGPPGYDVAIATMSDTTTGQTLAEAFHLPLGFTAKPGEDPGVQAVARELNDGHFELLLGSKRFAEAIALDIPGFFADDAYFHLAPGRQRTVRLQARAAGAIPKGFVRPLNARVPVRIEIQRRG